MESLINSLLEESIVFSLVEAFSQPISCEFAAAITDSTESFRYRCKMDFLNWAESLLSISVLKIISNVS